MRATMDDNRHAPDIYDYLWHFDMLHDQNRNRLYCKAIDLTVKDGDKCIDIGTGSGLLALMAARAGGRMKFACTCVCNHYCRSELSHSV